MNLQDTLKVQQWRDEEDARAKRRAFVIVREGIDAMTEDEMRRNLVTCDFRGAEVKAIILDKLIEKACVAAVEAERERQDRQ